MSEEGLGPVSQRLFRSGQEHLFVRGTESDAERRIGLERLEKQLSALDAAYPGGLVAYTERARELLGKSKREENPFDGYGGVKVPSPMPRFPFEDFADKESKLAKAEAAGKQVFAQGKVACVLVAGGLGERLGYSGIKVALPCEVTSNTSFLELYCEHIKALQSGGSAKVPFAIMTSDDTHAMTENLLSSKDNYGLSEKIRLIKQEKVASLSDNDARLTLDPNDRYAVLCKPHGHGDVHLLLHQSGLAKEWCNAGIEWVLFFQDTNPMSFRTLPAALGTSVQEDLEMNSIAIPRKAKAAAGAIMRLEPQAGASSAPVTINVEYNYIDGLLRDKYQAEGDVNDASGYSPFPGNMNQLVFKLKPYATTLEQTGGIIPEFVNPKYSDGPERSKFKPTRLECMMQDYPLTLQGKGDATDVRIGVTLFQDAKLEHEAQEIKPSLTHRLYAPAKNNLADAVKKASQGIPDAGCASTELAIYACNSLLLKSLGSNVQGPKPSSFGGVEQPEWPHIVFLPSFLPVSSDLATRFKCPDKVKISSRSSLVVQGDVTFTGTFNLDGSLEIRAAPGVKVVLQSVCVTNAGETFVPVAADDEFEPEVFRIRGFKLGEIPRDRCVKVFNESGTFDIKEGQGAVSKKEETAKDSSQLERVNSPIYLVFCATGKQGRCVVDALIKNCNVSPGNIFGTSRDRQGHGAMTLAAETGIKIMQADMNDAESLALAVKASRANRVWFMTDYFSARSARKEITQGKNVIDAIKNFGNESQVQHVVFSSVGDADNCPKSIAHFHSKAMIEQYLKENFESSSTTWTILRPAAFLENLDDPANRNPLKKGKVKFLTKSKTKVKFISTVDVGKGCATLLLHPGQYASETIEAASCEHSGQDLARVLSQVTGTECTYSLALPRWVLWLVPKLWDLYNMVTWFESDGFTADIAKFEEIVPNAMDAKAWFESKGKWSDGERFASS